MHQPKAIDLFCGCGGLTLGLKWAGFRVVGAVEIDDLAVEAYSLNHPDVKVWKRDIRQLAARRVMQKLHLQAGELDLLAGCPPCQGFSSMRTLNGKRVVKDRRNDLVLDFLRFVRVLKPKAVMMENVPGLARDWRLGHFCEVLTRLGYVPEWRILNAADYGVPQRRRRLMLLAGKGGAIPFASCAEDRRTVRDAIGELPKAGQSGDPLHDLPERRAPRIRRLITRIPKDGGSRLELGTRWQLDCHRNCDGFKDVYGRMAWDSVAPTITGGCFNPSKGRFLHPLYDRAITMREAALLQSFPATYQFPMRRGKAGVAWLIGNALPPSFVSTHGQTVLAHLEQHLGGAQ